MRVRTTTYMPDGSIFQVARAVMHAWCDTYEPAGCVRTVCMLEQQRRLSPMQLPGISLVSVSRPDSRC